MISLFQVSLHSMQSWWKQLVLPEDFLSYWTMSLELNQPVRAYLSRSIYIISLEHRALWS